MAKKYGYLATIGADTSGLTAALKESDDAIKNTSSELHEINKALKLDPTNAELIAQKYEVLGQQLNATHEKAKSLEQSQSDMAKALANNPAWEQAYEPLNKQLIEAKQNLTKLKSKNEQMTNDLKSGKIDQTTYDDYTKSLKEAENAQKSIQTQIRELKKEFKDMGGYLSPEEYRKYTRELENARIATSSLETEMKQLKSDTNQSAQAFDKAEKSVKEYDKALDGANSTTIKFSDLAIANAVGDLLADGFRRGASAIGDFVKQGITLASNLTEVQNVVDVTFGDGAAQIYEWADAAAESFGMSSLAAQEYNGTMGAMLKSMGLTDDAVRQMSMDMVGLAGDMASFYNLPVEQAFQKIRSGISGETEPLKQLGINMSVANLEAYALSQGIETAYKKMTEAEKATLRYNYLMSVTADAQGDFARTSDSFANQQKILELQTQNLAASLGEKLLPKINDLTGTLNENMPSIGDKIDGVGDIVVGLFDFVIDHHEAILSVITGIGTALAAQKGAKVLGDVTGAAKNLFSTVKSGQGVMSALAASLNTQPWVLAVGAVAALTLGLIELAKAANEVDTALKESAEESVQAYDEQTEKVKGLKQELDETNKKIAEIQSKGKLTVTDENELVLLQEKNDKLSGQLEIEKEILETKRQQAALDAAELANADKKKEGSAAHVKGLISIYDYYLREQVRLEKAYKDAIEENDTKTAEKLQKQIQENEKKKGETKIEILEETDALVELSKNLDTTTEEGKEAAAAIAKLKTEVSSQFGIPVTENAEKEIKASETYGEWKKRMGEEQAAEDKRRRAEELKDYEENLKAKVDELDDNLALRRISEEEYYQELGNYLAENSNRESKAYFEQLGRYEDYNEKKQSAAEKAAEKEKAAADKAAKDAAKAEEDRQKAAIKAAEDAETERVNAIKASWDKVTAMKDRGEIDEEAEYKLKAQIVKEYCDENEATWDSYYKWLYDYIKKQEDKIADAQLKAWEDSSKKLADTLAESYKALKAQKEQVKKDLQSIDLTETVTDKDGNEVLVLKDLDAEIKKIDKLKDSREKLKETGISDDLLAEIDKMNYADGSRQRYIDELLSLSPEKLQLYYDDWNKLREEQEKFAQDSIQDDLDATNQAAAEGVKDIFGNIPEAAYEDGIETARQYLQGIIDGMGDLDSAAALKLGGIADSTAVQQNPKIKKVAEMIASGELIPSSSVVKIQVNDKNFIQTTVGEMFSKGQITGGSVFNY